MFSQQVVLADKCIFLVAVPACDNPSASQLLYTCETVFSISIFYNILSCRQLHKLQITTMQIKSDFSASTSLIYLLNTEFHFQASSSVEVMDCDRHHISVINKKLLAFKIQAARHACEASIKCNSSVLHFLYKLLSKCFSFLVIPKV